jgi:hypothetical protein
MHVLDLVVVEVALVDAVEAVDVGVALVLEGRPVEGRRLLEVEAIRLGLVDRLGNGGGVEGDLLGDAAVETKVVSLKCMQSLGGMDALTPR